MRPIIQFKGKGIKDFQHVKFFKSQSFLVITFQTRNEKPTEASCKLDYCVALAKKERTMAERLIKPISYSVNAC